MESTDIFDRMNGLAQQPSMLPAPTGQSTLQERITAHRAWLQSIPCERPDPARRYRIGVYIRYFNQTRHSGYLAYHKKQFEDTVALCPNWELVDFYVDEGAAAPSMASAPAWCRLLEDCSAGKVDLILTQKISNVSRRPLEMTFCAKLLARQEHPVGIYFISEDIFTLASYYTADPADGLFQPPPDRQVLPEERQ